MYYKHLTIGNDDSSFINKCHLSLNDDARVIIYDRNMFELQATSVNVKTFFYHYH